MLSSILQKCPQTLRSLWSFAQPLCLPVLSGAGSSLGLSSRGARGYLEQTLDYFLAQITQFWVTRWMVLCRLGPIIYFGILGKVASLLLWVLWWRCLWRVSKPQGSKQFLLHCISSLARCDQEWIPFFKPSLVLFWLHWLGCWQTELRKTWPSHSVMTALFAAQSANCLPFIVWISPLWRPGRGITATCEGLWAASDSDRISAVWFVSLGFEVGKPLSFQIAPCTYTAKNAERGSVYMFTHFPSAAETAPIRAMISASWAELPRARFPLNTPLWGISAYRAHHLPGPRSCSRQWTPPNLAQPRVGPLSPVC